MRVEGLLRDEPSGSCDRARAALLDVLARAVPLVFVSNDGPAAVQQLQRDLGMREPFICDGGAAVYIPHGYFEEEDCGAMRAAEWHVFGVAHADAAHAVQLLSSLYATTGAQPVTVGLGCHSTDRSLLAAVDVPVIVRNDDKDHVALLREIPRAYVTDGCGVAGWSEALLGHRSLEA